MLLGRAQLTLACEQLQRERDLVAGIGQLAPVTDFIALGAEIWSEPDPVAALGTLWR